MMRLVFFMPSFSMGGAEKVTLHLVKHFSRNYDVSCIVMRDSGELRQSFHEVCPVERSAPGECLTLSRLS